jgi:gamma-glutamyl hercynylcysteine S-oxide synthase
MTPTTTIPELDRGALLDRFRRVRARTRELFDMLDERVYYDRPIALRNPIVFYEGHLPAFAVNTLIRRALGGAGIDRELEVIFARGIDPESEATAIARGNPAWPSRDSVAAYAREADRLIEEAIASAVLDRPGDPLLDRAQALWAILEHEEMHQETLAYMWHQLPYDVKRKPAGYVTLAGTPAVAHGSGERVRISAGSVVLGTDLTDAPFAWDNELPAFSADVAAFTIDADNVTNADFMEFVEAGGYRDPLRWREEDWAWVQSEKVTHPPFWRYDNSGWHWRGMFESVPLPPDWPVYVTWAEAHAYANWRGRRLPSEAEYIRAAHGTGPGNCDFERWDPEPVGARLTSISGFGVRDLAGNGWEWTADVFAPFEGFNPLPSYPEYSADFFDSSHFVLKGASPVTPLALVRPGFRNWFRPRYPYVYATFRCVGER